MDQLIKAGRIDQRETLQPEEPYRVQTKIGPVTFYYDRDTDRIIVQGRMSIRVYPRADNSIAIEHVK